MNQIFPQLPKDIRGLLWKSYLNELDRYVVFLAFLPNNRRKSDRRITELAGMFGEVELIQWMSRNDYGIAQLYPVIGRYGRQDLFVYVYTNICQPFSHLLHDCVKISVECGQIDFCVWLCSLRNFRLDFEYVIRCLKKNNYFSIANEIEIRNKGYRY
jgi:hypothetical protein